MNTLSWLKQSRSSLTGAKRWMSSLASASERMVRSRFTRVSIQIVQDGFTATLLSPYPRKACRVVWQETSGEWRPELLWRRLSHAAKDKPVDLEIPRDIVLSNGIKLPKAALANLPQAIIYGLSSWSPFQAEDVYVSGRLEKVADAQVLVRVHYVLRARADPLVARLEAAGLPVDRLVLDVGSNSPVALPSPKLSRIRRAGQIDGMLAAAAIALALSLGSVQVATMSRRIEAMQEMIRSELIEIRRADSIRTSYASYLARRTAVVERRAKQASMYEVLSALARHLPDGSVILALEVGSGRGRLELSGAAPEAVLDGLSLIPFVGLARTEDRYPQNKVLVTFNLIEKHP